MIRSCLVSPLLLLGLMLSACNAPQATVPTKDAKAQRVLPTPCMQDYGSDCPDPDPYPPSPPPTSTPYDVHSGSELRALAARLNVPQAIAAVPGAETALAAQQQGRLQFHALDFPRNSSDALDFMDKLYAGATGTPPSTQPVYGATTTDPICTTRVVDVFSPVSWNLGGGTDGAYGNDQTLYAGSLIQGGYLNTGVGSMRRIYSNQVANVSLTSPMSNSTGQPFASVPPYLANVNAAVSQIQNAGPTKVNASEWADVVDASSLEEAKVMLGIKGNLGTFKGSDDSTYTSSNTRSTVFVMIHQEGFWVDVSLPNRPLLSLFNNIDKTDLEALGQANQLGYDNLPLYVDRVTYGRVLLFSMSSNVSTKELDNMATLAFSTNNSASLTTHQKNMLSSTKIRVLSYGGTGQPTADAIKDGSYKSFFTNDADPRTMLPVFYEFKKLDAYGTTTSAFNPLHYTERTCNPYKTFRVNLSNITGTARVFVTPPNQPEQRVVETSDSAEVDLTPFMADGMNHIRIEASPNSGYFYDHKSLRAQVFVDDSPNSTVDASVDCHFTHTQDLDNFDLNKNSGQIINENKGGC